MRILLASAMALVAVAATEPALAQAVEYVKVCSIFGLEYFYDPGTDTCINANSGETKKNTSEGVVEGNTELRQMVLDNAAQQQRAIEGVALGLALPNATVDPGHTFGAALNVGTFGGASAIGFAGAFRANENVTFNGAVGLGLTGGTMGGRAGMNVSW